MSRPIDIDRVAGVLLADGWHQVYPKTFDLGPYQFVVVADHEESVLFDGGAGFGFSEEDGAGRLHRVSGPASSLLAVRYTRLSDEDG